MKISILVGSREILPPIEEFIRKRNPGAELEITNIDLSSQEEEELSEKYLALITANTDIAVIDCGLRWGPHMSDILYRSSIPLIAIATFEDMETYEHLDVTDSTAMIFRPLNCADVSFILETLQRFIDGVQVATESEVFAYSSR